MGIAASELDCNSFDPCKNKIKSLSKSFPKIERKVKKITGAVEAATKICKECKPVFKINFEVAFNELAKAVKEKQEEVKKCTAAVQKQKTKLGKFGKKIAELAKKVEKF